MYCFVVKGLTAEGKTFNWRKSWGIAPAFETKIDIRDCR